MLMYSFFFIHKYLQSNEINYITLPSFRLHFTPQAYIFLSSLCNQFNAFKHMSLRKVVHANMHFNLVIIKSCIFKNQFFKKRIAYLYASESIRSKCCKPLSDTISNKPNLLFTILGSGVIFVFLNISI